MHQSALTRAVSYSVNCARVHSLLSDSPFCQLDVPFPTRALPNCNVRRSCEHFDLFVTSGRDCELHARKCKALSLPVLTMLLEGGALA